jgi:hypothetical protein
MLGAPTDSADALNRVRLRGRSTLSTGADLLCTALGVPSKYDR